MINTYETIFICPGEMPQDKIEAVLEKVKSVILKNEGQIGSAELWGRRKMAYSIQHHRDGFYIYVLFSANEKAPGALNHHYRVTDAILRGLIVKVDPRHLEKIRPIQRTVAAPAESSSTSPAVTQAVAGSSEIKIEK
jgi:small subunit ribosomal protein S6